MLNRLWIFGIATMSLAACQTDGISFPNVQLYARNQNTETVPGLLATPEGIGPFPAVVLLTSCGGMTSHVTQDWPNYLTGLGYVVLTVNSLGARGYSRCTRQNFMSKNYHEITKDAYGALDYLASQPFVDRGKIAVMGFSMGAAAINNELVPKRFREKNGLDFKAAIALYGYCHSLRPGTIPLMQILAENDDLATACMRNIKLNALVTVHLIPGAYHAFDSRESSGKRDISGNLMQYDSNAIAAAREFTKAFLREQFDG